MSNEHSKLTRIGVFYDGNFFFHVSNHYNYHHERRARISISGLREFIRHQVAGAESGDVRYCQIVDSHDFRGRPGAQEADQRGSLFRERLFDDVLVREGVVTHYLPLGQHGEKGIDVWLSLEAYELAMFKRYDVCVLVACDGDFLPLVRKLNSLGTRVMLLAWDFQSKDEANRDRVTRTAQVLLDEVTYPVMMHQVIDDRSRRTDPLVNGLFVPPREERAVALARNPAQFPESAEAPECRGTIQSLKPGYGFITPAGGGNGVFFFHSEVRNTDFNDLKAGMAVSYHPGRNEKGVCAQRVNVVDPVLAARSDAA